MPIHVIIPHSGTKTPVFIPVLVSFPTWARTRPFLCPNHPFNFIRARIWPFSCPAGGWPTPTSLRSSLPTSPSWSFDHSYPPDPSHSRCRGRHGRGDHPSGLRDMAGTLEAVRQTPPSPNQATIGLQSREEGGRTGMVAQPATFWGIYRSGEDPGIQARYVQGYQT